MASTALTALEAIDIPYFDIVIELTVAIAKIIHNVQVYRKACNELSRQCVEMVLAVTENVKDLPDDTETRRAMDEVERMVTRIHRRVFEWSQLGFYKSVFKQDSIKEGIDASFRDLTQCYRIFSIRTTVDHSHTLNRIRTEDHLELRNMLQRVMEDVSELRLAVKDNRDDVPALMESVQKELTSSDLEARQEQTFRRMLWELREETDELPPLPDLTGQIGDISPHAVILGGSSDIHTGLWLDKEKVALKRHRAFNCSPYAKSRIVQEVALWRGLRHPHILPLYGVIFFGGHVSMVSPWMDYGNVNVFLEAHPRESRISLLAQVSDGLGYLHDRRIVHGDLRGINVLVSERRVVKIGDFGLSKALEEMGENGNFTTAPSSVRWAARELVQTDDDSETTLSYATDSWSFGMLCLELLTGEHPFSNIHRDVRVYSVLSSGGLPQRPSIPDIPNELWHFMNQCWSADPQARPSMREAYRFLTKHETLQSLPLSIPEGTRSVQTRKISDGQATYVSLLNAGFPPPSRHERRVSDDPALYDDSSSYHDFHPGHGRQYSAGGSNTYAPSAYASSISTSAPGDYRSYSRLSLGGPNPQFTDVSGVTMYSEAVPSPNDPLSTVKPSTSKLGLSSPPSPYHLPPTYLRRNETSPEVFPSDAVGNLLGGGMRMASALPMSATPITISRARSESTTSVTQDQTLWTRRKPKPHAPSESPPGQIVPLAPYHVLAPTAEADELFNQDIDYAHSPGPSSSSTQNPILPPVPPKDRLGLAVPSTSNQRSVAYTSSPEMTSIALPPTHHHNDNVPSPLPSPGPLSGPSPAVNISSPTIWQRMRRRGSKPTMPTVAPSPVFGRPLQEILPYAGDTIPVMLPGRPPVYGRIPILVTKCGFWLKTHGLHEVGIFHRDLPSMKPVRRLRAEFEKPPDYGKKLDMNGRYTAGQAAEVLRQFLTELPESVIPLAHYEDFAAIYDEPRDRALHRTETALRALDKDSRELLMYMCDLIVVFAMHAPKTAWRPSGPERATNMNSLDDLVRTFKPVLLSNPERDWVEHEDRRCQKALKFMLENRQRLMDDRHIWQ